MKENNQKKRNPHESGCAFLIMILHDDYTNWTVSPDNERHNVASALSVIPVGTKIFEIKNSFSRLSMNIPSKVKTDAITEIKFIFEKTRMKLAM